MAHTLHYFTDSLCSEPISYYRENFDALKTKAVYSGCSASLREKLISAVIEKAQNENISLEVIHHPLDNSPQGVILPELSVGAFCFDLWSPDCRNMAAEPGRLAEIKERLSAAKKTFVRARRFHDNEEKIYIENMDFEKADIAADELTARFIGDKKGENGREIHRFFGAATVDGNLDYAMELTENMPNRVFIKGRPGTGKSTLLKKLAAAGVRNGFEVECCHCALAPSSLDLVIIRELGCSFLDSTAPHEYFPSREGDEILDMYALCVTLGTDEIFADKITGERAAYKMLVSTAVGYLKEALAAARRIDESLPRTWDVEAEKNALISKLFG